MTRDGHAAFSALELAMVLSHYDLGVIESITALQKGSRKSPKVGIVAQRGKFLLKRLDPRKASVERVLAKHDLQRHLMSAGFPAPDVIKNRLTGTTYLRLREGVYELYVFIAGEPYSRSQDEAEEAGAALSLFHEVTEDLASGWSGPIGDFHDSPGIRTGLCAIGSKLSSHDSFTGNELELSNMVEYLLKRYDQAADAVNLLGFASMPPRVIHSDWHPGNILFRKQKVSGVIDYDAVRLSRSVADVANGILQFSMLSSGEPNTWPDSLDRDRLDRFVAGYFRNRGLTSQEKECVPHLMAEALIAECVPPITQTGMVGTHSGFRVLQMICRKLRWMSQQQQNLVKALDIA